jgi:hypothetical protein
MMSLPFCYLRAAVAQARGQNIVVYNSGVPQ